MACKVLQTCSDLDESKAQDLLLRKVPEYGHKTALEIAVSAKARNFLSKSTCQRKLIKLWFDRISPDTSQIKVIFFFFVSGVEFFFKYTQYQNRCI